MRTVWTQSTHVSVSTVSFTIKRPSETGANCDRKRSGRPKATTESVDKFLRVNGLHGRQLTGQQLQAQFNNGRRKKVSVSTVQRRLRAAGLTGQYADTQVLTCSHIHTQTHCFRFTTHHVGFTMGSLL
uniref:Transposase Tc1-like domain-containing protein n=1 Tax=Neolamprologus brichardi TaxID=32507 RepID=A0A3Q4MTK7_NEOBR